MAIQAEYQFCIPSKKDTTFQKNRRSFQALESLPFYPGIRQFYTNIKLTQKRRFGRFNLAIYWQRKYRDKQEKSAWYLLTNLPDLSTAVTIYDQHFGIEAMFKDCKTGGYNLEAYQANPERLIRLIFLIALTMSSAWLQGKRTKLQGQHEYVCRLTESGRNRGRHSSFWISLSGENWLTAFYSCQSLVQEMIGCIRNKKSFYQRGLRAIKLIRQPL